MTALDALIADLRAAELPPPDERRAIREAAGVSLRDASEALGCSVMTFRRWEAGTVVPRRPRAQLYRRLLDELRQYLERQALAAEADR